MQAHAVQLSLSPAPAPPLHAAIPHPLLLNPPLTPPPPDDKLEARSKAILEEVLAKEGLALAAYRPVPVKHEVVGRFAKATQPRFTQVVVKGAATGDALERQLFIARKEVEREARRAMGEAASDFYICSLSSRCVVRGWGLGGRALSVCVGVEGVG